MTKLKLFMTQLLSSLKHSFQRFPETMAIAYILVFLGMILIHNPNEENLEEVFVRLVIVLLVGLPYSALFKLGVEKYDLSKKIRFLGDGLLGAILLAAYFILPYPLIGEPILVVTLLTVLGFLGFILIPYLLQRDFFPVYVLKLASNFFVTMLYSLVMYLGIVAIVFAINELFDVRIMEEIYADAWVSIAGFFSVTYFLGIAPSKDTEFAETDYQKIFRLLFVNIIIPLLGVFTVILYAYFIKIVLGGEMPKNVVAPLVLNYGIISGLILFFIHPLIQSSILAKRFRNFYGFALIIPLGMMFFALYLRINQYGVTLSRYYSFLAGLWLLGTVIYVLVKKVYQPSYLLIYGMILLLLSILGPLSAYNITLIDQNRQFNQLLASVDMLDSSGKVQPNDTISDDDKSRIIDIIHYVQELDRLSALSALPSDYESEKAKTILGFEDAYYYDDTSDSYRYHSYYYEIDSQTPLEVAGYDYLTMISDYESSPSGLLHSLDVEKGILTLTLNDSNVEVDLRAFEKQLENTSSDGKMVPLDQARMTVENDQLRIQIILNNLNYRFDSNSKSYENYAYRFYVLVDKK